MQLSVQSCKYVQFRNSALPPVNSLFFNFFRSFARGSFAYYSSVRSVQASLDSTFGILIKIGATAKSLRCSFAEPRFVLFADFFFFDSFHLIVVWKFCFP